TGGGRGSEAAGRRHGLGGRRTVAGRGDAGAFEVLHIDVGGLGRAGRGVQRRDELRPLLIERQHRIELGLQVGGWVAGDVAGRQRRPPDQPAAPVAHRLRVSPGLLVHVPRDAGRGEPGVPVRGQEVDDRRVVLGQRAGAGRALRDRPAGRAGRRRAGRGGGGGGPRGGGGGAGGGAGGVRGGPARPRPGRAGGRGPGGGRRSGPG